MWTVCTILSLADIIMPVLATVLSREEKKRQTHCSIKEAKMQG